MPTIISGNKSFDGIFRAIVIEPTDPPTNEENSEVKQKSCRIYIPALHREQMPFKLSDSGEIQGCIFDSNEDGDKTSNPPENDDQENKRNDKKDEATGSSLSMQKDDYPIAQVCSWGVCPQFKLGEQVWVMFENGDSEFPVVIGDLASILPLASEVVVSGISGSGVAGVGSYIDIPEGYGTVETYEKEIITSESDPSHGWEKSSNQGQLRLKAIPANRLKRGNIHELSNAALCDNRLLIATKPNIGGNFPVSIGDYLDVSFSDGSVWNCILGDVKGADAPNPWGHDGGKSVVEIIYWDYSNAKNYSKKVTRITKVGNYDVGMFTQISGPSINLSDLKINQKISSYNHEKGNISRIKYIVIHYTGNNGDSASGNANFFSVEVSPARSAHYFVDETSIYQIVKDEDIAWHCGDGKGKSACTNSNSIGIEMCSKKQNGQFYIPAKTVQNAAKLAKALMQKYNIGTQNLLRHYDVSGKQCPEPFVRNPSEWDNFKTLVTTIS